MRCCRSESPSKSSFEQREILGERKRKDTRRGLERLIVSFGSQVGQGDRKGFNAAKLSLQINKHFGVMRGEVDPSTLFPRAGSLWEAPKTAMPHSSSILLDKIQDQQIYLSLTSTLLRLAKEAGTPEDALDQLSSSLLRARGLQPQHMLSYKQPSNFTKVNREKYNWLNRGSTPTEDQALLQKLQRITLQARQNEDQYRSLSKFKAEKSDEIAPSCSGSPISKKDRFKRMVKQRKGKLTVQSSDFYRFQVSDILQNSYKYENQCYRTIGAFSHLKTMFGHTSEPDIDTYSQIFNAILDKTDNFIITGGEEGLIKIWHRASGAVIANLKGHNDFLNKIDTSSCNKYLLTSAGDGLRFFDLASLKPLGGWKTSSIPEVSSFIKDGKNYFLFGDSSLLYVLTEDTMLANAHKRLDPDLFYQFQFGEATGRENCSIIVISMNPQKTHLLLGLQSGQMLMVIIEDLMEAIEANRPGEELLLPSLQHVRAHTQEIIQIKWNHNLNLWATGAKDGRCCLWELTNNRMVLLNSLTANSKGQRGRRKRHTYSCTYICWNCVYSHFAAGFQENVEEDDSDRGRGEVLVYSLSENAVTCELSRDVSQEYGGIRAMDPHPTFPNILLICEADGHILLFDIFVGCIVNTFEERGFHILYPQFQLIPTECHFTSDGLSFVVATEYGSISLYGYDDKSFYTMTPVEQFFQTDFEQFAIEQDTMRAIPLTLPSQQDINEYPRGDLLSVRGHKHQSSIVINPEALIRSLNYPVHPREHFPQINLDSSFLSVIQQNLKELLSQEQIYIKTYDQIQKTKMLVLFHERERQYLTVHNITNEKIKALKTKCLELKIDEESDQLNQMVPEPPRRTRTLVRHPSRQRVNYQDDFEYDQSKEEDYNAEQSFLEQDIPEELQEEFSDEDGEEEARRRRVHHRIPNHRHSNNQRQTRRQVRPNYSMDIENGDNEEEHEIHTRRRRRDLSDEDDVELEDEHLPKKKLKTEEQSEEHRGFSRLRKQVQENKQEEGEFSQCYRCQLTGATVQCFNCPYGQQFCDECSKMRGRRQKDKYTCLICIFLKNNAPEQHDQICEDNYRIIKRTEENYIPQLQDKVRFFFQGYEEFLVQNITKLNPAIYKKNEAFRLLPHTEDSALVQTPLCEVVSIDYYFPVRFESASQVKRIPGKGEKYQIQMIVGLKPIEDGHIFWVYYTPGQEYLVPQQIYIQIDQKEIISKLSINQLITIKEEQMQIVELGAFQDRFPQTIWKMVKVRKTQGKRLRGNTKDIQKRINLWQMEKQIEWPEELCKIDMNIKEILVEQVKIWTEEQNSPFCIFVDYVDLDIYPSYRQAVQLGMCLKTILARLQNNYYTGVLSLEHDVNLILNNSLNFNGPHHMVTKDAEELVTAIKTILNHGEVPVCSVAKSVKEDSTTKKQKKIRGSEQKVKESDENVSSFQVEEEILTKKKEKDDSHHMNTRKRRKMSSDYEEDSFSSEHIDYGVSTRRGGRIRNGSNQPQQPKRITRNSTRH